MNKKKLILISVFILISCSNQPRCDDTDIKNEVKQIMKKVYRDVVENKYYKKNYNYYEIESIYITEKQPIYYNRLYGETSQRDKEKRKENSRLYDSIFKKAKSDLRSESIDFSDSVVKNIKMSFNKIRIMSNNEDLKICECASNLKIGNDLYGVEYKAQATEDEDIYVELLDYNEIK